MNNPHPFVASNHPDMASNVVPPSFNDTALRGFRAPVANDPLPAAPRSPTLRQIRQNADRFSIESALAACNSQVPMAAAQLGISRAQMYRLISSLRIPSHHAKSGIATGVQADPSSN